MTSLPLKQHIYFSATQQTLKQQPFFSPAYIQPKLTINQPNDEYEQEADAVADKVMLKPAKANTLFIPAITSVRRKCAHCEEEEKELHRKEYNQQENHTDSNLDKYISNLPGTGKSLSGETRSFFEPRIGYDFSNIKVHNDSMAAKSAQSINALAYTVGNNIVFNSGQYSPETDNGKRLLAHELTHVVQQQDNKVQSKFIQRDGPAGTDPTQQDPLYVQPGGPFDVGDNIFTLQWAPDGLKFGFPIPGAAPGADNANLTLFCPNGQRRAWRTGDCCDAENYNAATGICCEDDKVPQGTACVDAPAAGATNLPPSGSPVLPNNCPPGALPYMGGCLNANLPQLQPGNAQQPTPTQGLSGTFPAGTISDFNIDESVLNARQDAAYQRVLSVLRLTLHNCPATVITITGFADAPGIEAHNLQLSQNRADFVRTRLLFDLFNPAAPIQPLIIATGEGTAHPVDTAAGQGFSSQNRRVEISMNVSCPEPRPAPLTPPFSARRNQF